jgi:NAD(P)-dependent dehydrogenase (short-subunit alcohol dehydrogenase family)
MRWVITGANRGIGLEFARQLAQRGEMVEAGVRDLAPRGPIAELALGSNVNIHPCDVGSDEGVAAFARSIGDVPVDVLINNAGVMGKMQAFEDLDLDDVMQTINVNAIGVIRVTRALMPNMLKGTARRIVHISSGMGSIADNGSGGAYGYRMSKAALNMANKSLSVDYKAQGFTCVVMNPGWVQTDMGGHGAPTPVEDSVRMMLRRIDTLSPANTGEFVDYKGGVYPY